MESYRYLIVGGGMTADAACRGIRSQDADGSIGLFGAEEQPPYARPPLSKKLWAGGAEESIWRGTAELGVDLRLGRTIVSVDLEARCATDDSGETYGYERLLLATGGTPRRLPFGGDTVIYFRTLADYRQLRSVAVAGTRVVVIGGGFIGSELAAALAQTGCAVTMVFPEAGIGARVFPADLSAFVTDFYRAKGVEVLAGESVTAIEDGAALRITTGGGRVLEAEAVVAGLGIQPNVDLARTAGLPVDDGILVDELGRAGGRDDVFAAGDVARFPTAALGGTTRVEHEDHANTHGSRVGANMAGANEPYGHLPFFYSDLFELGYEAVGELDARHDTLVHWTDPNRSGVVAYVDAERRPRGFLLWDVWGRVDAARDLITGGQPMQRAILEELVA
jgi:3-phenylpropionate/trans-cinnamate dioxygenase ferredoxin reductase component